MLQKHMNTWLADSSCIVSVYDILSCLSYIYFNETFYFNATSDSQWL